MSHEYGDERIIEWLREHGYHPRSPKHGSASCLFLLDDLLHESDLFADAARNGEIVYQEDHTVGEGPSRWNTDLVVGPPDGTADNQPDDERPIARGTPERIWLAIDAKSVMTEHGKARRNRQRDINSFADIMHRHHPGAVSGGVLLINMAERFKSPLRDEGDVTEHDRIEQLVEGTVEIFRDIDRAEGEISPNVDAVATIVVDHTNMDDGHETRLVTEPPAPQSGDVVHYRDFLEIVLETLEERFLAGEPPSPEDLAKLESLQYRLNQRILAVAHQGHLVSRDLGDGVVEADQLGEFRNALEAVEDIVEEIEENHGE